MPLHTKPPMSVSLCVCLFRNSSETTKPDELIFLKKEIACSISLEYATFTLEYVR